MNWPVVCICEGAALLAVSVALAWACARSLYKDLLIRSAIEDVTRANALTDHARRYALRLSQAARIGAGRAARAVPPSADEEDVSEAIEVLSMDEAEADEALPPNIRTMEDVARSMFEATGEWPEDRKIAITGDMGI
jgi:hypothetical protein